MQDQPLHPIAEPKGAPPHEVTLIGADAPTELQHDPQNGHSLASGNQSSGPASLNLQNTGGWLITAGVGVLIFILFKNLRKNRKRAVARSKHSPRDRIDEIQTRVSGMNDMHGMTARAQESVQTLITQLENKAARLELLLDKTEARIAEFDAKIDQLASSSSSQPSAPSPRAPGLTMQSPPLAEPCSPEDSPLDPPLDPLHQRVHALADQGLDSIEIARQVNRPTGQIDLILALRRA